MLWILFKISVYVFHGVLLLYFMHSRLRFKPIHQTGDVIFLVLFTALLSCELLLPEQLPTELGFLLFIPYALIVVKDKFHLTLFWLAVFGALFFSVVDIAQFLLHSIPGISAQEVLFAQSAHNALFTIVYCSLLFLAIFLVSRFRKDFNSLSRSNLLLFLALILCIYMVEKLLFHIQTSNRTILEELSSMPFLLAYIGLYLCTLFTISLFHRMSALTEMEVMHQEELNALFMSKQHQQELERLYDQLSIKQHDFKQHMQTLTEMVRSGGNESAEAYLETYRKEVSQDVSYATGCPAVDALLTAKHLMMCKAGVDFQTTLCPLHQLPLSTTQFCTVLGNLLDNALEAVSRIPDPNGPVIQLRLARPGEMLCLICTNPCNPSTIRQKNNLWFSSKAEPEKHSIGIRNIRRIVEDAEGRCEFALAGDHFTAKILLPYSFPEESAGK